MTQPDPKPDRLIYTPNSDCPCAWCTSHGQNPHPGYPATAGYEQPHIPKSRPPWRD